VATQGWLFLIRTEKQQGLKGPVIPSTKAKNQLSSVFRFFYYCSAPADNIFLSCQGFIKIKFFLAAGCIKFLSARLLYFGKANAANNSETG